MMNNEDDNQVVTTQELADELNLDDTETNHSTLSGLLQDAQALIRDSFTSTLSASKLKSDPIFTRAVKALATSMYYDRTLSNGIPIGVQMMIDHLKGEYEDE